MNKSNRIIREYLESLKEDSELDALFPTLLSAMDFRIVSTPRNSKGQSQYGKDVVAIGKGDDGIIYRWYFELKGNAAKDITDANFNAPDGVRASIQAAKDTPYEDSGIPAFNHLPIKIVFVHNGLLHENTRSQYEGFIRREFPEGGFERWDIEKLTHLIGEYLFDENLFVDDESSKLLKKILVLLDAPGWRTKDVEKLVDMQLERCGNAASKRVKKQIFASLHLMLDMIYQACDENGNLLPAKRSSDVVVLKTWKWMLCHHVETKAWCDHLFEAIVLKHIQIYVAYMNKLLPLARTYKGLYMPNGGETERVLYGVRCFDFLGDLIYLYDAMKSLNTPAVSQPDLLREQRDCIIQVIRHNSGFDLPRLDTQSIPILMALRFMLTGGHTEEKDGICCVEWVQRMVINLNIYYRRTKMLPEVDGDTLEVAKSMYVKEKSYNNRSSLLLTHLAEIAAKTGDKNLYKLLYDLVRKSKVDLQVAYPVDSEDLEEKLFSHRLQKEMAVEVNIKMPKEMTEFDACFEKRYNHIPLRTERSKYRFLETLAHVYFRTDLFPDYIDFGHLKPKE